MRNAVLAIVVLALATTAAPGQDQGWANKLFDGNVSHDFGSVPRGDQLYYRFPMRNRYAVRLEIVNVRASCGCVTATPSAQVLEPSQTGYIEITMDARRFTGSKTVTVYVTVGPQYVSMATLQVSAHSRADVVFNPGQITFGVVPRGQKIVQTIDVEYAGGLDWRVSEVIKNGAPLDITLEELYRRVGQVGYRVRATLKPDAPAGLVKQDIMLKTNDPASPLVPILVEATVQAPLTVVPNALSLGQIKVGDSVSRRVVVRGSKPFHVLAVEGLGDGLQADLPLTAAAVQILTVKYQPPKAGDLNRQLHIKTDLDSDTSASVSVEGTVVP